MYSLIRHVNKSILWSFPVSVYFRLASDSSEAFSRAFDILEMTDDGHLTSGTNRYFRSSILVNSDVQEFSLVRRPSGDFDAVTTRETSHGNNHVVSSFSTHSSVNGVQLDKYFLKWAWSWMESRFHAAASPLKKLLFVVDKGALQNLGSHN